MIVSFFKHQFILVDFKLLWTTLISKKSSVHTYTYKCMRLWCQVGSTWWWYGHADKFGNSKKKPKNEEIWNINNVYGCPPRWCPLMKGIMLYGEGIQNNINCLFLFQISIYSCWFQNFMDCASSKNTDPPKRELHTNWKQIQHTYIHLYMYHTKLDQLRGDTQACEKILGTCKPKFKKYET